MKRLVLFFCGVFCSFGFSQNFDREEKLASSVLINDKVGYFCLSDGSLWKVITFTKRWRSLGEWWEGVQLAPESYETSPKDWLLGSEISICSKFEAIEVNELDAVNHDELKQCTHLLMNQGTRQVLFAIPLTSMQCMDLIFKEGKLLGYEEGYNEASMNKIVSHKKNTENAYKTGYETGKKIGFEQGYEKGYEKGYERGILSLEEGASNYYRN